MDAKNEIGLLFKQLITKVADWETTILKHTLIEEVINALMKFTKSLTSSLLISKNHSSDTMNIINTKSFHVSTLITEEILLEDAINLTEYSKSSMLDIIKVYRSDFLNETIDPNNSTLESLTENLATKNIANNIESEESTNESTPTNHYRHPENNEHNQHSYISTTIPSNLLKINNSINSSSTNSTNTSSSLLRRLV